MGTQHYSQWNSGCDPECTEEAIVVGSSCEIGGCFEPKQHPPCGSCAEAEGAHVYFDACDGYREVSISSACQQEEHRGRVLDVTATLKDVCPGRSSALGIVLTEVDADGTEHARGFQAVTVPAHSGRCHQDITADTVRFILPEEMSLQQRRHFIVRTQHHYLDAGSIWNNRLGG